MHRSPRISRLGFRRFVGRTALSVAAIALSACAALPRSEVQRYGAERGIILTDATKKGIFVFPEGERPYAICLEPSPDAAANLTSALALAAKGGSGAASGEASLSSELTQTIVQLVARSQGLQLQRDVLTHACLAFVSGGITKEEYLGLFSETFTASTAIIIAEMVTAGDAQDLTEAELEMLFGFADGNMLARYLKPSAYAPQKE